MLITSRRVLLSGYADAMAVKAGSFDFLLDTIPVGHGIVCDVEMIGMQDVNEAWRRV